jgi:hypothetical protein
VNHELKGVAMNESDYMLAFQRYPHGYLCSECGHSEQASVPGYFVYRIEAIRRGAPLERDEHPPVCETCAQTGLPCLFIAMQAANATWQVIDTAKRNQRRERPMAIGSEADDGTPW